MWARWESNETNPKITKTQIHLFIIDSLEYKTPHVFYFLHMVRKENKITKLFRVVQIPPRRRPRPPGPGLVPRPRWPLGPEESRKIN